MYHCIGGARLLVSDARASAPRLLVAPDYGAGENCDVQRQDLGCPCRFPDTAADCRGFDSALTYCTPSKSSSGMDCYV